MPAFWYSISQTELFWYHLPSKILPRCLGFPLRPLSGWNADVTPCQERCTFLKKNIFAAESSRDFSALQRNAVKTIDAFIPPTPVCYGESFGVPWNLLRFGGCGSERENMHPVSQRKGILACSWLEKMLCKQRFCSCLWQIGSCALKKVLGSLVLYDGTSSLKGGSLRAGTLLCSGCGRAGSAARRGCPPASSQRPC